MDQSETPRRNEDIRLEEQQRIQTIMGRPPGWILRYGITAFGLAITVLLLLSWWIRYPDTVSAPIVLTTKNPPIRVVSPVNGKIAQLWARPDLTVNQGDHLALLDNPARLDDVLFLETFLYQLDSLEHTKRLAALDAPPPLTLGLLQDHYSALVQNLRDYQYLLRQETAAQKIEALSRQAEEIARLNELYEQQRSILEAEVSLFTQNYERQRRLNEEDKLSSDLNVEEAQVTLLQKKRELENLRSGVVENRIRIKEIRVRMLDLEQNRSDELNQRRLTLVEDIRRLRSRIADWKQTFLVTAPVNGTVVMTRLLAEQEYVEAEQELMAVLPGNGSGPIIGQAKLPSMGSGKVEKNMRVRIRLDGYPFREFGVLTGRVNTVAPLPGQGAYLALITVPQSLVTTYGIEIPFHPEMLGTADIITREQRLIERLFDKLRNAALNN